MELCAETGIVRVLRIAQQDFLLKRLASMRRKTSGAFDVAFGEAQVSRARRQDRRAWRHHEARRPPERKRRRAGLRSPEGDKGVCAGFDEGSFWLPEVRSETSAGWFTEP